MEGPCLFGSLCRIAGIINALRIRLWDEDFLWISISANDNQIILSQNEKVHNVSLSSHFDYKDYLGKSASVCVIL